MKVIIIGCGTIGGVLAEAIQGMPEISVIFVKDKSRDAAVALAGKFSKVEPVDDVEAALCEVDLLIEAASQDAAREYIPMAIKSGTDALVLSVGVFADYHFRTMCDELVKSNGACIHIPSGAIAGLDGLKAAKQMFIDRVLLITTKHPDNFEQTAYLTQKGIVLNELSKPVMIFDGRAVDAVHYFPKNINVAATLAMMGAGFARTHVKIIADPTTKENRHNIIIRGDFGVIRTEVKNVPHPKNPATSYLAALSAVSSVKEILIEKWKSA